MTATAPAPTALPTSDVDPFSHEVLENPLPMHEELREAGPVVYLNRYGIYAVARYDEVYAALVDWQRFQSAAGVGMSVPAVGLALFIYLMDVLVSFLQAYIFTFLTALFVGGAVHPH